MSNEGAKQSEKLSTLRDGDEFEGFYAVRESSFQTAVNGKNYIRMTVADATASFQANLWDANRDLFQLCPAGSIVRLQGLLETYKGKAQIRIFRIRPAHDSEVDIDSFLPSSTRDPEEMRGAILRLVESLTDRDYRALAEAFFHDAELMREFVRAPAARDLHHAVIGGLLEHTLGVAQMADSFSKENRINRDLLLVGALLHDIGKITELSARYSIEYTDRGKLLGHLYIGAEMVRLRVEGLPGFPVGKRDLLQHMILSHHGRYEYGSPVLPKIPEAFALHHLDNLDAKVATVNRLLDGIDDPEKNWTEYSRALETQLYAASATDKKHG